MPAAADVLTTLHLLLQIGFISVTLLLLLVTAVNRMRVRRVLLAWRVGRFLGLPLWPAVFLAALLLFLGAAFFTGQSLPPVLVGGYLVGGGFWLAARLLSASVLVTEYGLLPSVNRAEEAIAWGQIVDYFETTAPKSCYVFFYLDESEARRRFEMTVPRAHSTAFRRIIGEKLDARFELSARQVYGKKALEG